MAVGLDMLLHRPKEIGNIKVRDVPTEKYTNNNYSRKNILLGERSGNSTYLRVLGSVHWNRVKFPYQSYEVELEGGEKIYLSGNQEVRTDLRGWVRVKDLYEGEDLYTFEDSKRFGKIFERIEHHGDSIEGAYVAISKNRGLPFKLENALEEGKSIEEFREEKKEFYKDCLQKAIDWRKDQALKKFESKLYGDDNENHY